MQGQLVTVASGRAYPIPDEGIRFGGTEAEVLEPDVEGAIASLDAFDGGFILTDEGAATLSVNARPVIGQRFARFGDTIRVADQVFVIEPASAEVPAELPSEALSEAPTEALAEAPAPIAATTSATLGANETPSAIPPTIAIAQLEMLGSGPRRGERFPLVTRLTMIGRGAHNDVVLDDDTVSESHARIVRRGAGWVVLDEGSSNGTYVAGQRIDGEQAVAAGSEIRFGGVKLRFEPIDGTAIDRSVKETRQVVARPRPTVPEPPSASMATPTETAGAPTETPHRSMPAGVVPPEATPPGRWRIVLGWGLVLLVLASCGIAGYLLSAMLRGGR